MERLLVPRTRYLEKLRSFMDRNDIVKVITGMRRCGKSTLLCQFQEQLRKQGVTNIIYMNFESRKFDSITDYVQLNKYFDDNINTTSRVYVFLDEIQRVKEWEKSVNSMLVDNNADIYITGSNAYLLSSELATYLSGRYVEIQMLPLSFSEYIQLHPVDGKHSIDSVFNDYLGFGAIPMINPEDDKIVNDLLIGIYSTIIRKDISLKLKTLDLRTTDNVVTYLMSNIGNMTNCLTIAKDISVSPVTVKRYLQGLEDAFLIYKALRFDVNGKKFLNSNEKYYSSDTGIRNAILNRSEVSDIGHMLENIVFLELKRRGYKIAVGSYYNKEIDFIASKDDYTEYYQVSATVLNKKTLEREVDILKAIPDVYPKTILTLDRIIPSPIDGIRIVNAVDWLLKDAD